MANLARRIQVDPVTELYLNPDIVVSYEMQLNGQTLKTGDPVKIKHDHNLYRFRCLAHNVKLDTTWVDLVVVNDRNSARQLTGGFRSVRPEQLKTIAVKRSRRGKKDNE
jgi:hypothetical protein